MYYDFVKREMAGFRRIRFEVTRRSDVPSAQI
jgi:hypothetical protein